MEAAIKFAPAATGRARIAYAESSFDGLTAGALSIMDNAFGVRGSVHDCPKLRVRGSAMSPLWKGTGGQTGSGIRDPSNLLWRVQPVVHVDLEMSGEMKARNRLRTLCTPGPAQADPCVLAN